MDGKGACEGDARVCKGARAAGVRVRVRVRVGVRVTKLEGGRAIPLA